MDQYKKINGTQLQLQVDNKLVYSPNKNKQKGIKTVDFKEDTSIKLTTIVPTKVSFPTNYRLV
jgi:hypothetical protein